MPKPIKIMPMFFVLPFLMNMMRMIPAISASGARVEGLKNSSRTLPPASISIRRMIWAVTVVPMFAPMTMLTACRRFKMPAPMRPTVRTIVAVELWMMAVTMVPVRSPRTRKFFRAGPEPCFKPSPMISMP